MTTPWDAVMSAVTKLSDRVDALPSVREATVAATSPLSVLFDTDSTATLITGALQSGVAVGDRVLTLRLRHYIWVLGVKGGPKVAGGEIPTAADLNTYTTAGIYVQSNNGKAAAGTNYPTPYAGTLVVRVGSNLTFQEYTTYSNASGGGVRRWLRGAQGAVWKDWKLVGMPGDPGIPLATAAGSVLFPAGSTAVAPLYYSGALTVTFPAGRFSTPPVVEVAARGLGVLYASVVGTPTATGFSCVVTRLNAALVANSHYIDWTATQMTPTSGAG